MTPEDVDDALGYLEAYIEIFVMAQFSMIPFKCSTCDDFTRKELNCYKMYEEGDPPVWFSSYTKEEYYACPISMIPKIIYEWYDEYQFDKEFSNSRSMSTTPALYWWFVKTYKRHYSTIENKLQEDNLKSMKNKT